jgi:hypothetical protein
VIESLYRAEIRDSPDSHFARHISLRFEGWTVPDTNVGIIVSSRSEAQNAFQAFAKLVYQSERY